jgi:diguanylate cyclase (GGDEF)-like protein/PAS domain S-box-containing protein
MPEGRPNPVLQSVIDALPDEIAIVDEHGQIVQVNRAWAANKSGSPMVHGGFGDDLLRSLPFGSAAGIQAVLHGESSEYSFAFPVVSGQQTTWFSISARPFAEAGLQGALIAHSALANYPDDGQLLESLIDSAPLAIVTVDLEGRVTRWNPAAERLFGWDAEEVIGAFLPSVPVEFQDEFLRNFSEVLKKEEGISGVRVHRAHRDGTLLSLDISHAPVHDRSGAITGVIGIIADVTERVRAETRHRFFTDGSAALSRTLDERTSLHEVAGLAVPGMADCSAAWLLENGKPPLLVAAAHADAGQQVALLETGACADFPEGLLAYVTPVLENKASLFTPSVLSVPLMAGNDVAGILCLAYSTSGRVYNDDDLAVVESLAGRIAGSIETARLFRESREAEHRLRAVVEHVPAVTYRAAADDLSQILYISSRGTLPDGWTGEQPRRHGQAWINNLVPEDRERTLKVMEECSRTGNPLVVEYRVIDESGNVSWRLDQARLVRDEQGNPLYWQGVAVVITEQKLAEEALQIRARQQAAIARLSQRAVSGVPLYEFIWEVVAAVNETIQTEFSNLMFFDEESQLFRIMATDGMQDTPRFGASVGKVVPLDMPTLTTFTWKQMAPIIFNDLTTETRFVPWGGMIETGIQSGISVIIPGREHPEGVMFAITRESRNFTEDDVNFLQSIANLVAAMIERERNEEQLRFQAHLLDVIRQAVVALDEHGRITYWNRHAEETYGWTADEVMGCTLCEVFVHDAEQSGLSGMVADGLSGQSIAADIQLHRKDGSWFTAWAKFSPLESWNGSQRGVVWVSTDITERVLASKQLMKSESRYRAATEGTMNAFAIFEPVRDGDGEIYDYRFAEANSRAEALLHRSREQMIGNTITNLFEHGQFRSVIEAFNIVAETGKPVEREVEVLNGPDSFWMQFHAVPLDDGIAAFANETTEQRRLEAKLLHQAYHDSLTGLPNRAFFLDRVERARMNNLPGRRGVAIMFLDLDNFKVINDSLGHSTGDQLLIEVAARLRSSIDRSFIAARFGGDEFAVLLEDLPDWATAAVTAEEVLGEFDRPFRVHGRELFVTASIGVAFASSPAVSAGDLLRHADTAMYRAKRNGRARVELFAPSLSADATERFELENDLRRAIERNEFLLHYQPVVRLATGEITAMEALVRWEHPVHGQLSPAQFIPVAEETGLIVPIGQHVLAMACRDAHSWNRSGAGRIRVSVNISPRQFRHPEIIDQVVDVLTVTGLEPDLLFLEITESMMVEDIDSVRETLLRLREIGVHVAVDDFGTGYSSLGSLRQLPVEIVKIDRTFVSGVAADAQDAVMLSGMVELAHRLGLVVIAEGVESVAERDRLRAMGCDLAQGYFFSVPVAFEDAFNIVGNALTFPRTRQSIPVEQS